MDLIPKNSDLNSLLSLAKKQPAVVSIYIPTHPSSTSQSLNADKARFKNALQSAEDELKDTGLRQSDIHSIMNSAWKLYDNLDFWQHRAHALAVFLAPNVLRWYTLPIETDELTSVGEYFVLAPLAIAASMGARRHVLKLNLKQPTLFLASWNTFEEIELDEMPGGIEETLRISSYEKQLQHNVLGAGVLGAGAGKGTAAHHGHGGAKDNRDDMVKNYLKMVDNAVSPNSLRYPEAPFILAGTSDHTAIYNSLTDKKVEHVIDKDFASDEKLKEAVMNYFSKQFEVKAREFTSEVASSNGLTFENFPFGRLAKLANRGQIKSLGVGFLNATMDSALEVQREITKLDFRMDKQRLGALEKVVRGVLKNGGEIIGTFMSGDKRGLQAVLRYQT